MPGRWIQALARTVALAAGLASIAACPAEAAWQPEPAAYGVGTTSYTVPGYGGTPLHVSVLYPTAPATGQPAPGPFPVLFTQSPYGALLDAAAAFGAGGLAGKNPYLVQRGYIEVDLDVRGTGSSEGKFGLLDPVQGEDGATVARWAARLPHSSGVVGLYGGSYLGVDQFPTAVDAGPNSEIKAMFPVVAADDVYRDLLSAGGLASVEFNLAYAAGLLPGLALINPVLEGGPTALQAALSNALTEETNVTVPELSSIYSGGSDAFEGSYWAQRSPITYIPQIVADKIPAFLIGGWYDLFQRGEPLNYAAFQNAHDGRPPLAPMAAHQPVTGRYQLLDGDYFHVTSGDVNYRGMDFSELELAWFDHWLKGIDTGIDKTSTPLHLWDLGTSSWREAATYPLAQAQPTTYYFHAGGGLSTLKPTAATGSDQLIYTPGINICSSSNEQQLGGLLQLTLQFINSEDPCVKNASLSQAGPSTVSYTTAPFALSTTLAGPIGATIFASANTKDTAWAVSISDVAPNGTPRQLTAGLLDGSLRAVDPAGNWTGADGRPVLPYHPYTQASQQPVTPGAITRYDIEVFPTMDTLAPGHRLRVTVATGDFPHTLPTVPEARNMVGGVYQVQRSAAAASGVELPISSPAQFGGPPAPLSCGTASGRISGPSVGPVRLGRSRAQVRGAFIRYRAQGSVDYFCLTRAGIRVGYVHGRAALALTSNRHYAIDGVSAGAVVKTVAARLGLGRPLAIGANTWYFGRAGAARTVFKVRRGVIEEIGLAIRSLTSSRAAARRFFERIA